MGFQDCRACPSGNHMNQNFDKTQFKKGFAKIILVVVIVILVGIAGYFLPTPLQVARLHTNTSNRVSTGELAIAKELFRKNNIDIGTLAVVRVEKDEFGGTHIRSDQFYKGLPIFFEDIIYHFDASGFTIKTEVSPIDGTQGIVVSGERIGELDLSIEPKISMYAAARKAREKMKLNYFFTAELGILDLNAGISYAKPNFVLVWKVKPRGVDEYPYTVIDANNGRLLKYDDGIRY